MLSEYIAALQAALAEHGDHPVTKIDAFSRAGNESRPIDALDLRPVAVKAIYGGFHRSDTMATGGFGGGPTYREPMQTEVMAGPDVLVYRL